MTDLASDCLEAPPSAAPPPAAAAVPRISIIMPTHNQAAFLPRAVASLVAQTVHDWELVIVDDASPDDTGEVVRPFLLDPRVRYLRRAENGGVGRAINDGLAATTAPVVGYLPSDDVLHRDHLATLLDALAAAPDAVIAVAGVRHHYNRETLETVDGWPQLVQVAHRRVDERWIERDELVTDDLDRMYWSRLAGHGEVVRTGRVTCEWVAHPDQLTNWIREPLGGINPFRQRYAIPHPLRFATSVGDEIDEVERYRRFRDRPPSRPSSDALRILLVGELSYNPERILAIEERGHRLFGLWTRDPAWYTTVGPVPFGHVEDVTDADWAAAVRRIRPDVIYGLLNWHAVPFAAELRRRLPDIPFVWHFKEGPFICRERGTWPDLVELTARSGGVVHSSLEMARWFASFVPDAVDPDRSLVIDGDLPKADWFAGIAPSRRLSEDDGEIHTVVPGRPIGLHPEDVAALAGEGIHLHFHGTFTQGQWREWIERTRRLAPRHLHLHPTAGQEDWVRVFSRYDAGWLHAFRSTNGGDLAAATWDDLNLPARMATLAAAGIPMIQRDNTGSTVAIQTVGRELGVGLFYDRPDDLASTLRNEATMGRLRSNVAVHRPAFTFDDHADRLIELFRRAIDRGATRPPQTSVSLGSWTAARPARSRRSRSARPA
jgi:glycosyltransferase involved in cell wall biosynthesis